MIHRPSPELWTPNRKAHEAMPLCPRCFGIDVKKMAIDHRDFRRYFTNHRACCCAPSNPCAFRIRCVVAGVNAGICVGCYVPNPIDLVSRTFTAVNVDGTYDSGTITADAFQNWSVNFTISNPCQVNQWAPSRVCSGAPGVINKTGRLRVVGKCGPSFSGIRFYEVRINDHGGGSDWRAFTYNVSSVVSQPLGTTVATNHGGCTWTTASITGTVQVSLLP